MHGDVGFEGRAFNTFTTHFLLILRLESITMEALGVASSVVSLLHIAKRLYGLGEAAYKSEGEKAKLKNELDNLTVKLEQLKVQENSAREHPYDRRYDNLRAIINASEQFSGKNEPNRTLKEAGMLERLQNAMVKTESELMPKHGCKARARRLLWYHDRKKFQGTLAEIRQWAASVDSILIGDTNDRVRTIEDKIDHSTRENEKKALEKTRKAIVTWLSSLKFKERQSALLNQMQTRLFKPNLLMSKEFEMWKKGRSWILHCQGMPGSGKVCLSMNPVDSQEMWIRSLTFWCSDFTVRCYYQTSHRSLQE